MHAVDNPDSIAYVLADSGALLVFVDTLERWQAIVATGQPLDHLKRIVCADAGGLITPDARIVGLDHWLAQAPGATAPLPDVAIEPDDLAAIVYTSGTTGRPKGVMLSHGNVVANVKAIACRIKAEPHDVLLSFLPLSHTFEGTGGYYYPIAAGACVAYTRSVPQLSEDLKHVQPTVLVSVPRIYERIYALIMQHRAAAGWIERTLFDLTVAIGGRRRGYFEGAVRPPELRCERVRGRDLHSLPHALHHQHVHAAQLGRPAAAGAEELGQPRFRQPVRRNPRRRRVHRGIFGAGGADGGLSVHEDRSPGAASDPPRQIARGGLRDAGKGVRVTTATAPLAPAIAAIAALPAAG